MVKAIHVTDGDHVHTGDVLIELDPTANQADQEHVARDLVQAQLDVARLSAALTGNAAYTSAVSTPRRLPVFFTVKRTLVGSPGETFRPE